MATDTHKSSHAYPPDRFWQRSLDQCKRQPLVVGLVLITLGVAVGVAVWFALEQREGRELFRRAQEANEESEYAQAYEHLLRCAQIWPRNGEVRFQLARAARRLLRFDEARRFLKDADRLGWPSEEILLEQNLLQLAAEGPTPDVWNFLKVHLDRRSPEELLVLETISNVLFTRNRWNELFPILNHWVRSYPDSWRPHFLRGDFLYRNGQYAAAEPDLEQALELKPDYHEARGLLIKVLLKNGKLAKAQPLCEEFLRQRGDHEEVLVNLARCQRAAGKLAEARSTLERARIKQPQNPSAMLVLAQIEADEDRGAVALDWLTRCESYAFGDLEDVLAVLSLKANVLRRMGRDAEATPVELQLKKKRDLVTELGKATDELREQGTSVDRRLQIGKLYLQLGLENEANQWLLRVTQENPRERRVHEIWVEYFEGKTDSESRKRLELHKDMLKQLGPATPRDAQ